MHMNPRAATLFNPLNAELNPICYLLALLGAHHILHVNKIGVKGESPIEPDVASGHAARTSVNISRKFFGENRVIKSRVTRWATHVVCMGETRNSYRILGGEVGGTLREVGVNKGG